MELDFDEIFRILNRALYSNRVHPCIKKDKKWCLQTFLLHGWFTLNFILIVYAIFCIDLKENNFTQTCKDISMFLVYIVVTIQYSVFIFYRKSLLKVMNLVKRDYSMSNTLTPDEREIVKTYANLGNRVCKQWIIIVSICGGLFLLKSISLMLFYYFKGVPQLVPFYDMRSAPFIEERKDNIYVYLILYISYMEYAFYACVMYGAFVPLGPFLMLHASGQLAIVKKRIDNLFTELNDEVITEKLREIVIHLQQIYRLIFLVNFYISGATTLVQMWKRNIDLFDQLHRILRDTLDLVRSVRVFVDLIGDIFKVAYELTLKFMAVMLPVSAYEVKVTMHQGEISLEFISFVVGATLFSSTPCYYSQLLMDKGEEVRQALYFCGWEHHYNRRTRITLHILLMYARRPVAIKTVYRTLCLNGMTELFQTSYKIFNLMNAVWV